MDVVLVVLIHVVALGFIEIGGVIPGDDDEEGVAEEEGAGGAGEAVR
jgi:hypothetical protein